MTKKCKIIESALPILKPGLRPDRITESLGCRIYFFFRMPLSVVVSSYCLVLTYVSDKSKGERSWQNLINTKTLL